MKYYALLMIPTLLFANPAFAIKKCKDADGNWHYGDVAVAECENSKITTLNDRGFVTDQEEAPKTEEELEAEKEEREAEEARLAQERAAEEERRRILSIYETEEDIDRQRDNQLNSVQSNIDVHKAYLKSMDTRIARYEEKKAQAKREPSKKDFQIKIDQAKKRVEQSKKELAELVKQKDEIIERFSKEKEIYLALKNGTQ